MSAFDHLKAAHMTGAHEVRIINLSEEEIFQRAREGFIFAHPGAPAFIRRLVRSGRMDRLLAAARQALRDIEKPVDFLTHEARAAWVLNMHSGLMTGMNRQQREAVAQMTVTAIRVGTKDSASPPHAIIHSGGLGPIILALVGAVLAIAAIVMVL